MSSFNRNGRPPLLYACTLIGLSDSLLDVSNQSTIALLVTVIAVRRTPFYTASQDSDEKSLEITITQRNISTEIIVESHSSQ